MNFLVIVMVLVSSSVEAKSARRLFNRQSTLPDDCVSGDGSSYRGTVSRSESGRMCLNWGRYTRVWGSSKGIGYHNFCRNPSHNVRPWCLVQSGSRVVRENCRIPQCSAPTLKPSVDKNEDTELTCGQKSQQWLNKIVGGSFTPIQSQPWVAAIFSGRRALLCGGSLIAPCWVLTAAHCFEGLDQSETQFTVYLGKNAINETNPLKEQKFMVEKVVTHRKYDASNYNYDIALLKIKNQAGGCAVKSATSRTVCLPPAYTQLPVGFQCTVAGYGKEHQYAFGFSKVLKEGHVNLISQSECKREESYRRMVTGNMMCAASPNWNVDACKGDSGGPLLCEVEGRTFLFGVVSWGEGCAQRNHPGVYTKVTNFNKWIAKNTGLYQYTAGIMYPTK